MFGVDKRKLFSLCPIGRNEFDAVEDKHLVHYFSRQMHSAAPLFSPPLCLWMCLKGADNKEKAI